MSIATTARTAGPFAGTGALVALPFAFKVFAASDLVVQRTSTSGAVTTLTLTTHYSVSLNADQDTSPGGTVTLVTALASGETAMVTSNVAATQPLQLASGGPFLPQQIEDALDRTMIIVQQQGVLGDQTLRLPLGQSVPELPTLASLEGRVLGVLGGRVVGLDPSGPSAVVLEANLASTADGKGASLVGLQDTADNFVGAHVEAVLAEIAGRIDQICVLATSFGAIADSNGMAGHGTDNTAALSAAISYAVTNRCTLVIPSGNGLMYRHTGPLPVLLEPLAGGIGRGCIITGTGPGSVIFNDSPGDSFVLDSTSGAADMGTQIKLHNMRFHSNTGTRPSSFIRNKKGINTSVTDMHFMSVFIAAGGGCVINEVAYGLRYERNIHRGVVGTGLVLRQQPVESTGYSFVVSIDACDFSFCTTGVYAEGANCLSIRNTPVQQCTNGIVVDPVANGVSAFNITLENVWFENNTGWDLDLRSNVSSWCEASIRRCQFGRDASNTKINLGSKSRVIVEGIAAGPGSVEVTGSASAAFTGFNTVPKFIQSGSFFWNEIDAAGGISTRYMGNDAANNIVAKLGAFVSRYGSVSVPSGVATTLTTLTLATSGNWLVSAGMATGGAANWSVLGVLMVSNGAAIYTALKTASVLSLSVSGANLQASQASGSTYTINWSLTRMM